MAQFSGKKQAASGQVRAAQFSVCASASLSKGAQHYTQPSLSCDAPRGPHLQCFQAFIQAKGMKLLNEEKLAELDVSPVVQVGTEGGFPDVMSFLVSMHALPPQYGHRTLGVWLRNRMA